MKVKRYKIKPFLFIVVVIIMISCLSTFYLNIQLNKNKKQIESDRFQQLLQIVSQIECIYYEFQNLVTSISDYSYSKVDYTFDYKSPKITKYLIEKYKNYNKNDLTCLLYPLKTTDIIVNGKLYTYDEFEESSYYAQNLTVSGIFQKMNSIEMSNIMALKPSSEENAYRTAFLYPIPLLSQKPKGALTFLLRDSFYQNLISENMTYSGGNLWIVNNQKDIIYTNLNSIFSDSFSCFENVPFGASTVQTNTDYVVMRYSSLALGLDFYYVTIANDYYKDAYTKTIVTFVIILLVSVVCLLIFLWINHKIKNTNAQITSDLDEKTKIIQSVLLKDLIHGKIKATDSMNIISRLNNAGINIIYPEYLILTIQLDCLNISGNLLNSLTNQLECISLPQLTIKSVTDAEANQIILIVNMEESFQLQQLILSINELINSPLHNQYRCGLSQIYHNPLEFNSAYIESVVAINYRIHSLHNHFYQFNTEENTDVTYCNFPYAKQAQVEQCIKSGNMDAALLVIENTFQLMDELPTSFLLQQCYRYDLINLLTKISMQINYPIRPEYLVCLSNPENQSNFKQKILDLVKELSIHAANQQKESKSALKKSLIQYVKDHYKEESISLDSVSEEFHLSYSYVSKIFKEETSLTFSAYITELRMQFVKEQLINTTLSGSDIIMAAGYHDPASFMRKFKQREGITMGQYRNNNSETA